MSGIGWTPPPITADEIVKREDIKVEEDDRGDVREAKGQRKIQGRKQERERPADLRRQGVLCLI